ncbi:MAG: inorganic pyrophosphatase Ppa [Desulfatibacillaceae bacterium]
MVEALLAKVTKYEVQEWDRKASLSRTHVSFSGTPRRHALDEDKLLLVSDPLSTNTFYYEFFLSDIGLVEKLPSQVTVDGEGITVVRLWVRKGAVALRSTPFVVADTDALHPPVKP